MVIEPVHCGSSRILKVRIFGTHLRSEFFGPKNSDFGLKICFCYRTPNFFNGPFVSPSKDGPFRSFGLIFRLFVSELQPFCKKETGRHHLPVTAGLAWTTAGSKHN